MRSAFSAIVWLSLFAIPMSAQFDSDTHIGRRLLATEGYKVLHTFGSSPLDGASPRAGLVLAPTGVLYGTTSNGGSGAGGTVFSISQAGQEAILYSFCEGGPSCLDGSGPGGGLTLDGAGNLYGTTVEGGTNGDGTIFEVDQQGVETVLYNFCSVPNCTDGSFPTAGLIEDSSGRFYGTTAWGGANDKGTVFELDTSGRETVLYSFCSLAKCADGANPQGGVILDTAGNLYGTTLEGGTSKYLGCTTNSVGCGTAFKISSTGEETVLYSFCTRSQCEDGYDPWAGLIQDSKGNLYGTTVNGGAHSYGTVFRIAPSGREVVLYNFCSAGAPSCTDGANPVASLALDVAGNLYGTTDFGGNALWGTVFKVGIKGQESVLYSFCSRGGSACTDGSYPLSPVVESGTKLFGTTAQGGANQIGVVFELAK